MYLLDAPSHWNHLVIDLFVFILVGLGCFPNPLWEILCFRYYKGLLSFISMVCPAAEFELQTFFKNVLTVVQLTFCDI